MAVRSRPPFRHVVVSIVLGCVIGAAWTSPAWAIPFKPVVTSCVSASGDAGACTTVAQGDGLWELEVSPDGRHAYGSAWDADTLIAFDRNPATGALTPIQCFNTAGTPPCTAAKGLAGPDGIEFSQDGEFLYVGNWLAGIAAFDRNSADGTLTQATLPGTASCITNDGSFNGVAGACINGRGLGSGVTDLVRSPDGKHLYGASSPSGPGGVAVIRVQPDGSIDQAPNTTACVNNTGGECFDGQALDFARQLSISPEGDFVYVPTRAFRGIVRLARNATTGALTQASTTSDCITFDGASSPGGACDSEPRIATDPLGALMSGDGRQVYLFHDDGVVTFGREQDGTLRFQSCLNDAGSAGCDNGRNTRQLVYAGLTPDGDHLVVNALAGGNGVSILRRSSSGDLASVSGVDGCISASGNVIDEGVAQPNGCAAHPAADGHGHVEVVDNERLHVGSYVGSAVMTVRADYYPTCLDRSATAPHNTSIPVELSCSDRNGDPVGLAISQPPVAGTLGAVDAVNSRVFYNPFSGYSGPDSFKYTGTANGLTSEPATVGITVAPPGAPGDADGDGSPSNVDCNDNNPAVRPGALDVPGDGVDQDCTGTDSQAATAAQVRYVAKVRGRVTRLTSLRVTRLPQSAEITLRCNGKGCPFRTRKVDVKDGATRANLSRQMTRKRGKGGKARRVRAKLRAGARVEVLVTAPNRIGQYTVLRMRRAKLPRRGDGCLRAGTLARTDCPG